MAGFGKSSRAGKRHAASSMSSFSYYVTIVVFVAFCILGVWMLSSSSVIPPQATTDTSSRISSSSYLSASKSGASRIVAFRDPPLDAEEDAIKGDDGGEDENRSGSKISSLGESRDTSSNPENQIDSASSRRENENRSGSEEESKGRQELERPQEAEKNQNGGNEENQEQPVRENKEEGEKGNRGGDQRLAGRDLDGGTEDSKRLSEEEIHEQEQREHDEQLPSGEGEENQQETQQPQQTGSDSQEEQIHEEQQREHDEQLPNHEGEENQREPEQQQTGSDSQEEQTHEEQQREHDEQLPGGEGEQNQQESQQLQQTEGDSQGNQQESQPEIDENHDQVEEKIQQVTNENQPQREESVDESQTQSDEKAEEGSNDSQQQEETGGGGDDQQQPQSERQMEEEITNDPEQEGNRQQSKEKLNDPNAGESLTERAQSDASKDSGGDRKMPWATQADHSDNEKERRREETLSEGSDLEGNAGNSLGQEWKLCNVTAGPDYIPCLDNEKAIKQLHSFRHFEHRERHCPEEGPACLVPLPDGYKRSIEWPKSRDRIWYSNVPRTKLAEVKGHQNWVKVTGEYLTFPGGGTQFIHGALHYIDFIQQSVRDITWGKHSRVVLDVGCGVASFGGYLFERDVLTMSFAPKDEHEAQVQFALERGIPAISAVMGSQRLPFPSMVFDVVHCARCRVPWHAEGGTLLLELNRVLRPGGYFVWSATPVYQKLKEDVDIWKAMKSLTISMCWDLVAVKKDKLNSVAAAFYRKPISNECYDNRKRHSPPMCKDEDDPNAAWYIPLKPCMHRVPVDGSERASRWPKEWPRRLQVPPFWLNSSQMGIYGKPAPVDFTSDYEHWKRVVAKSYLTGFGIRWSNVRNVMDMRAVYGGFAAALKDLKVWVMNVVNIDDPDTLPIIYERGLFGIYHDWCESFSTYPRSYDLLHADRLFSQIKQRCKILPLIAEVDRIVRPGGKIIVRDDSVTTSEVEILLKSLHWEVRLTFSKDQEGILCAEKSEWRPEKLADSA